MNLKKLFETQAALDEHIIQEHPELRGQNNLDWKLLALQVELGECANEWRGFKKWSKDQEPRTKLFTWINGLGECKESKYDPRMLAENLQLNAFKIKNPLLEEYVDVLHFILSIGNEIHNEDFGILDIDYDILGLTKVNNETTIEQFNDIFKCISSFAIDYWEPEYVELVSQFLGLGEMLGFTWEQVEEAYYAKNKVNHARQESGY